MYPKNKKLKKILNFEIIGSLSPLFKKPIIVN